ncbi:hypothetical protein C8Q73DRAFT_512410 [Cubamyces lactineus]|nr:hypothetical protein C8Q73DRAFT_512410 [Cubamyces lactineus]
MPMRNGQKTTTKLPRAAVWPRAAPSSLASHRRGASCGAPAVVLVYSCTDSDEDVWLYEARERPTEPRAGAGAGAGAGAVTAAMVAEGPIALAHSAGCSAKQLSCSLSSVPVLARAPSPCDRCCLSRVLVCTRYRACLDSSTALARCALSPSKPPRSSFDTHLPRI